MISTVSLKDEKNPWLAAEARFDNAARRLQLDDGMRKVLKSPAREITVNIPVQLDDGRLEVFTGAGRRRRWTSEQKARIVSETYESGETVSAVARRHGLTPQQLFAWRRAWRRQPEGING